MNNKLILNGIRKHRDYVQLVNSLRMSEKKSRVHRAHLVSGLAEGADEVFRCAIAEDITAGGDCGLFIFNDDRDASMAADLMQSCGIRTLRYPSKDFNFNNMTASHDFENERLSVLAEMNGYGDGSPFIVCAGIGAALQITMPPSIFHENTVVVEETSEVDIDKLAASLVSSGYKKTDIVEVPGQFAVRGGIIDIYASSGNAFRLELFGDEIDRMGCFDPESQRFTDFIEGEIVIPPAREIIISDEAKALMRAGIDAQIKKLTKQGNIIANERSISLLRRELHDIENLSDLPFADKYLPLIYRDGKSLIEIFDGSVVLTSPTELESRADSSRSLLEQSITDMLEHSELPAIPDISRGYMKEWADAAECLRNVPSVITDTISRTYDGISIGGEYDLSSRHIPPYGGRRELFDEDIRGYINRGWTVVASCETESERAALTERLIDERITSASGENLDFDSLEAGCVITLTGGMRTGFELPLCRFALLDYSSDMTGRKPARAIKKPKKKKNTESIMSYADLEVGDLVVHSAYGIGQYLGLQNLTVAGVSRDYVTIKYAGTDQLFLPVDQLDLVSKYIGAGSDTGAVKLSKMGGADWNRTKTRAKAATREMAKELIELYAKRKKAKGTAFAPDDDLCREFAASFEYEETDGQLAAIEDVRRDMEAPYPMDRLICGDVGYGKTEIALRAAFKAVMSGKQVALLVPTTILAYQHYKNFKSRMRAFPANVDMVSRFRSPNEQRAALRKLKRGETDIIIGTHRLISNDVEFYDLGLVIIDEEQRFGVGQKEKLKKLATGVDVLTLTATPIPRTLNMAMGGIVDMSLLDEAPGMRAPVQTYVLEYDENIIYEALRRELRRNGQAFYMYNRVEGIYNVAGRLAKAIPDARIAVAHGKMDKDELEEIWESLVKGEIDILVCTTIIETGVDIPNANTLIIENADMYGLAQLHQIRGRVGRSGRRAYAYFTYKKNKNLTEIADKRLSAIKEYAQFGAGFRIALRDLEIRGAGNLLGAEQHGHMEAVGYDLYMKLLNEAVLEEKGEELPKKVECAVDIQADAYLSKNYLPFAPQRMDLYKKIARITTEEDYEDLIDELCDRFGEPGSPAVNLCKIALIRAKASHAGLKKVIERNGSLQLIPEEIDAAAITALSERYPLSRIKVNLGAEPSVSCQMPKNVRNTDFIMELIETYSEIKNQ